MSQLEERNRVLERENLCLRETLSGYKKAFEWGIDHQGVSGWSDDQVTMMGELTKQVKIGQDTRTILELCLNSHGMSLLTDLDVMKAQLRTERERRVAAEARCRELTRARNIIPNTN